MSNYMNPVDREYIEALFPLYLLEQPITYDLWNYYYKNKKLFQKLHEQRVAESEIGSSNHITTFNNGQLNYHKGLGKTSLSVELRREIWSNLMSLGVLGTIPFDSTNDEYLIQVYKYFYPNDIRVAESTQSSHLFPETSIVNSKSLELSVGNNQSTPNQEGSNPKKKDKNNKRIDFISSDIYSTIGYNLPTRWLSQPNNALFISDDVFSKLTVNPNWQNPLVSSEESGGDNIGNLGTTSGSSGGSGSGSTAAFSYTRNRLRNELTNTNNLDPNKSNPTSDYAMTWSNNNLPSSKLAIFYYEVKILSVSSSEGGRNSNIIVGFKYSRPTLNGSDMNSNKLNTLSSMYEGFNSPYYNDHTIRHRNRERRRRRRGTNISTSSSVSHRRRSSLAGTIGLTRMGQGGNNSNPEGLPTTNDDDDDIINDSDDNNNNDDDSDESDMNDDDNDESNSDNDDNNDDDDDDDIDITSGAHRGFGEGTRRRRRDSATTQHNVGVASSKQTICGIDDTFFGYNGFDGNAFSVAESESFAQPFGMNDIIGCGINYINGTIFFTKNGILLGTAFSEFHDINLVPAIALKNGNSVQTNFGLFEEFSFDILTYQNKWKSRAYSHIFNSSSVNHGYSVTSSPVAEDVNNNTSNKNDNNDDDSIDIDMKDANEADNSKDTEAGDNLTLPFLLGKDERFDEKGQLMKLEPSSVPINKLQNESDSIPSSLNCLINGYLIHEGLIDVAKGFLKDLQNEIEPDEATISSDINSIQSTPNVNTATQRQILRYNERQIIKEEKMLRIRQEMRKLIKTRQIHKCIEFLDEQFPSFLSTDIETLFELKLAQFLINIEKDPSNIEELVAQGQELSNEFAYVADKEAGDGLIIMKEHREKIMMRISKASYLLAYDSPLTEAPEDLLEMLSPEYIQDRLFQTVNSNLLLYLNQSNECALEKIVGYTRTMFSTMRQYHLEGDQSYDEDPELGLQVTHNRENKTRDGKEEMDGSRGGEDDDDTTHLETRYYKIVNLDEDILNVL